MRDDILKMFSDKGALIQPEAADYLLAQARPIEHAKLLASKLDPSCMFLSLENIIELEAKARTTLKDFDIKDDRPDGKATEAPIAPAGKAAKPVMKEPKAEAKPSKNIEAPEPDTKIKEKPEKQVKKSVKKAVKTEPAIKEILEDDAGEIEYEARKIGQIGINDEFCVDILQDITGNSTCEGKMEDFKNLFNDRYRVIRRIIRQRGDMRGATSIDRLKKLSGELKLIGIVSEVRVTKNKHKMLEIEDDTGSIAVLIRKDSQADSEAVVNDEIIGIVGRMTKSNE